MTPLPLVWYYVYVSTIYRVPYSLGLLVSAIVTAVPLSMESCALQGESVRVTGVGATWSLIPSCSIMEMPVNAHLILIVLTQTTAR